jgi:hypothetical protein
MSPPLDLTLRQMNPDCIFVIPCNTIIQLTFPAWDFTFRFSCVHFCMHFSSCPRVTQQFADIIEECRYQRSTPMRCLCRSPVWGYFQIIQNCSLYKISDDTIIRFVNSAMPKNLIYESMKFPFRDTQNNYAQSYKGIQTFTGDPK